MNGANDNGAQAAAGRPPSEQAHPAILHAPRALLAEVGFRAGTSSDVSNQVAATVRYQKAMGRRVVLVWDGFASYREGVGASDAASDTTGLGGRFEVVVKF